MMNPKKRGRRKRPKNTWSVTDFVLMDFMRGSLDDLSEDF